MRRFAFCSLLATTSISFAACSAPSKGALILAISTDMQAPKDIDVVSLYIVTNGVVKFDYMGRVLPDGTVSLPSTLALVEPEEVVGEAENGTAATVAGPADRLRHRVIGAVGKRVAVDDEERRRCAAGRFRLGGCFGGWFHLSH